MLDTVKLLLPALIPSWNFFDVIAASPRIEYALAASKTALASGWREFRPRPQRISLPAMLRRLIWNPRWNETLFVVACAERLLDEPTAHSQDEIFRRIAADLTDAPQPWLRFRIVLVSEQIGAASREIAFTSEPCVLAEIPRP